MKKTKNLIIDGDHIAFFVAKSKLYTSDFNDDDSNDGFIGNSSKIDLNVYKEHFRNIVDEYRTIAEVESICYKWKLGKTLVVMSDKTNFRYEIDKNYKSNRRNLPKDEILTAIKEWARTEYMCQPNTEADDVVAYYVRNGDIGVTTDKDLFKGVAGTWFNAHYMHRSWVRTSKRKADLFFKCQVLAGDSVDGIKGIKGIGLHTAKKLLKKYGDDWNSILKIYKEYGYTKEDMIQTTRLVAMNQWSPKKGVELWTIPQEI